MIKLATGILLLTASASGLTDSINVQTNQPVIGRRAFLSTALVVLSPFVAAIESSVAFDNRLDDQYLDRTSQTGRQPDYLGVKPHFSTTLGKEYTGLAPCDGRPNCWSSGPPFQDQPARYIYSWDANGGSIRDVKQVIATYEVGQQGIDGGGFKIIEYDEQAQYLQVQFQSYKNAYIDDLELWYNPEKKTFNVRSASRLGQYDLGVNAKRLEYIGARLENEMDWKLKRRKNRSLV